MRVDLGRRMALRDQSDVDLVAGVPDSGLAHAIGYANETKITYGRPFIKYTPTWARSFMPSTQTERNLVAGKKLIPVQEFIKDKKMLLIDDSIVRGTQLGETTQFLYDSGAKEVHVRPACPPLLFGCKYLNFSRSSSEMDLISRRVICDLEGTKDVSVDTLKEYTDPDGEKYQKMVDEICRRLNFTSLDYARLDELVESIGIDQWRRIMINEKSENTILDYYGCQLFSDDVMRDRLPNSTYRTYKECIETGEPLSKETATVIANAMKVWAIEKGATHFTHWFTPMTGLSAEKHDSFLEIRDGRPLLEFSGKTLRKGESDASSFPSGGLRATFEARGYTAWDCTSPAFVKDGSLYIPTVFCSYNGEALDKKTPLLKSCDVLSKAVTQLMPLLGVDDVKYAKSYVGAEQEYFLVADEYYQKRMDLKLTGRTLFGANAPKGQELEDHYFGSLKRKVAAFMKELDGELWKYGIPSKTKHNEAAPAQHEVACIYREVNITTDNNHLLMQLLQDIAKKHGLRCLLHEKPFAGVNGSGKHNNWSVVTDSGINLFNPGKDPMNNLPFLATLACLVKGIDEYADLLRITVACAGNDHRLGANEAPPAIISMYLGEDINRVIDSIINKEELVEADHVRFNTGVSTVADFSKDNTDRNRTSPFALTGNKFEFRAVGSSQSIAGSNTILNAILAHEINEMISMIEDGKKPLDVIRTFFKNHLRVVFDGDGYSKEWEQEANRRGLANRKNTVDAISHFTDEKNIRMLSSLGVYSEDEINSRYDILLENYIKTIHVEALTSLKMVKNEIYPAIIKYIHTLAQSANELNTAGIDNEFLKDDLTEFSKMMKDMKSAIRQLEIAVYHFDHTECDILDKAKIARDEVVVAMNELRKVVDLSETKMDSSLWPMPNYVDLMFGI